MIHCALYYFLLMTNTYCKFSQDSILQVHDEMHYIPGRKVAQESSCYEWLHLQIMKHRSPVLTHYTPMSQRNPTIPSIGTAVWGWDESRRPLYVRTEVNFWQILISASWYGLSKVRGGHHRLIWEAHSPVLQVYIYIFIRYCPVRGET